jgi:hypothetical protein
MEIVLVNEEGVFGIVLKRLGHASLVRYYVDGLQVDTYLEDGDFEEYDM